MNSDVTSTVLQIKSGARELGGYYTCSVAVISAEVPVLIIGELFSVAQISVLFKVDPSTNNGQLKVSKSVVI